MKKKMLHVKISCSISPSVRWHCAISAVLVTAPRVPREQPVQAGTAAAGSWGWVCSSPQPGQPEGFAGFFGREQGRTEPRWQVQGSGTLGNIPSAETPTWSWSSEGIKLTP